MELFWIFKYLIWAEFAKYSPCLARYGVVAANETPVLLPVREAVGERGGQAVQLGQGLHGVRIILIFDTPLEDIDTVVEWE